MDDGLRLVCSELISMRTCILIAFSSYESTYPRHLPFSHYDSSAIWCAHRGNLHRPQHHSAIASTRGRPMLRCGLSSLLGIGIGHCQFDKGKLSNSDAITLGSGYNSMRHVGICASSNHECRVSRLGPFRAYLDNN